MKRTEGVRGQGLLKSFAILAKGDTIGGKSPAIERGHFATEGKRFAMTRNSFTIEQKSFTMKRQTFAIRRQCFTIV